MGIFSDGAHEGWGKEIAENKKIHEEIKALKDELKDLKVKYRATLEVAAHEPTLLEALRVVKETFSPPNKCKSSCDWCPFTEFCDLFRDAMDDLNLEEIEKKLKEEGK